MNAEAKREIERLAEIAFEDWSKEDFAETLRAAMIWAYMDAARVCEPYTRPPHTFASENSDRYQGFRDGAQSCLNVIEARARDVEGV